MSPTSEAQKRANANYYAKNRPKLKRAAKARYRENAAQINADKRAARASRSTMKAMGIK